MNKHLPQLLIIDRSSKHPSMEKKNPSQKYSLQMWYVVLSWLCSFSVCLMLLTHKNPLPVLFFKCYCQLNLHRGVVRPFHETAERWAELISESLITNYHGPVGPLLPAFILSSHGSTNISPFSFSSAGPGEASSALIIQYRLRIYWMQMFNVIFYTSQQNSHCT